MITSSKHIDPAAIQALLCLQEAANASRQLRGLWRCNVHARLLLQPLSDADAASNESAAQLVHTSLLLLNTINTALDLVQPTVLAGHEATIVQLEQLLQEILAEQRLLPAVLVLWLQMQQQPEKLWRGDASGAVPEAAAAATAASAPLVSTAMLWQKCLVCLARIASSVSGLIAVDPGNTRAVDFADRLTQHLTVLGELWCQRASVHVLEKAGSTTAHHMQNNHSFVHLAC